MTIDSASGEQEQSSEQPPQPTKVYIEKFLF